MRASLKFLVNFFNIIFLQIYTFKIRQISSLKIKFVLTTSQQPLTANLLHCLLKTLFFPTPLLLLLLHQFLDILVLTKSTAILRACQSSTPWAAPSNPSASLLPGIASLGADILALLLLAEGDGGEVEGVAEGSEGRSRGGGVFLVGEEEGVVAAAEGSWGGRVRFGFGGWVWRLGDGMAGLWSVHFCRCWIFEVFNTLKINISAHLSEN